MWQRCNGERLDSKIFDFGYLLFAPSAAHTFAAHTPALFKTQSYKTLPDSTGYESMPLPGGGSSSDIKGGPSSSSQSYNFKRLSSPENWMQVTPPRTRKSIHLRVNPLSYKYHLTLLLLFIPSFVWPSLTASASTQVHLYTGPRDVHSCAGMSRHGTRHSPTHHGNNVGSRDPALAYNRVCDKPWKHCRITLFLLAQTSMHSPSMLALTHTP